MNHEPENTLFQFNRVLEISPERQHRIFILIESKSEHECTNNEAHTLRVADLRVVVAVRSEYVEKACLRFLFHEMRLIDECTVQIFMNLIVELIFSGN